MAHIFISIVQQIKPDIFICISIIIIIKSSSMKIYFRKKIVNKMFTFQSSLYSNVFFFYKIMIKIWRTWGRCMRLPRGSSWGFLFGLRVKLFPGEEFFSRTRPRPCPRWVYPEDTFLQCISTSAVPMNFTRFVITTSRPRIRPQPGYPWKLPIGTVSLCIFIHYF